MLGSYRVLRWQGFSRWEAARKLLKIHCAPFLASVLAWQKKAASVGSCTFRESLASVAGCGRMLRTTITRQWSG